MNKIMNGKNVVITGASDGIGKKTAEKLAIAGANLYLVGRNRSKTEAVADRLRKLNVDSNIEVFIADLSLPSQVKKVASEIKSKLKRLDVLLNNAGALFSKKTITAEGHESTFALNHLNYFLLTHELLDLLKASGNSRIVNTASQAHVGAVLDFDNLQGEKSYSGWKAYQMSKLENIMFTYELADRLKDTKVTVNALHPGFVHSQFGNNNSGFLKNALGVVKTFFAMNEDRGSMTSFYLCSSPDVETVTGKYFDKCKIKNSTSESKNIEKRKRLWSTTEEILRPYL
ncbi:SDR family oxidoreductase [Leptospira sp. GIMC2001]|uniref:SDR family oxidoreductase n=1 Tax=Leptospira sp. GIMC2001 TaxID=1513297 RepID=UPI002349571B|nr:SDR family oxidoreductase [Leptospira sp. GIMC2001]WCL49829.1 SDR family oxidoreductase [Leptospira sp. GIMC2001]